MFNPFAEVVESGPADAELVEQAKTGQGPLCCMGDARTGALEYKLMG